MTIVKQRLLTSDLISQIWRSVYKNLQIIYFTNISLSVLLTFGSWNS
jgi:hypothetical protein